VAADRLPDCSDELTWDDIGWIISRTLVYGLLTGAFTLVYLAIVVGIGTLVGSQGQSNLWLSIVATGVVALAFQPARDRSRRLANRLVYGSRATPYEVLSAFSRAVAGASADDSLQRMARLVVEATGAVRATVWLRFGEVLQPQAGWPRMGRCRSPSRWKAAACRRPWTWRRPPVDRFRSDMRTSCWARSRSGPLRSSRSPPPARS
jgi:hypothetical protein